MKFINRTQELQTLQKEYRRTEASLVIVYGRRRIGKTALIRHFIKDKRAIYFLATEEPESIQQESCKNLIAETLKNDLMKETPTLSWESQIKELCKASPQTDSTTQPPQRPQSPQVASADLPAPKTAPATQTASQPPQVTSQNQQERMVFVIDEFQYLGMVNKAFPSIFQKLWDLYLSQSNVMVILCGSLISMMVSQTLSYSSPLYGRRTAQIKLKQIPFAYYGEFFADSQGAVSLQSTEPPPQRVPATQDSRCLQSPPLTETDLIERYAITGGVPKYIEIFAKEKTLLGGVQNQVFSKHGFLYEEPLFLLQREVYNPSVYMSILYIVASRTRKMQEITTLLGMKRPAVTHHMKTLMDLDLIERVVPVTVKNPDKSKFVEFRLRDNFLQFWFSFAQPFLGELELEYPERVIARFQERFIQDHVSFVYERICTELLYNLMQQGVVPPLAKVGRWWNKQNEIDIVGFDTESGAVLFAECKYTNRLMDVADFQKLLKTATCVDFDFPVQAEHFMLCSKSGFTPELKELAQQDSRVLLVQGTKVV